MIYSVTDVKKACNKLLRSTFPEITIYNNDTLDGYKRPSFFTEIRQNGFTKKYARYVKEFGYTFIITLFETTHDESYCLEVYQKIADAFRDRITIVNSNGVKKYMSVDSIEYSWIDEHSDKLQVMVNFDPVRELGDEPEPTEPVMEDLNVTVNN